MKPVHIAASFILLTSFPALASGADLSGQSRTYLADRQAFSGARYLPLYEYLDLQATNIGDESVSFQFGGWYRYDLKDVPFRDRTAGDLQYAYLDIRKKQGNAFLRLGRVLVNEGVAASQVDGAYARTDLKGGFTAAVFGGSPVETNGDTRSGDSVYGGRLSYGLPGVYTLGLSYLREKNDNKDFRKEEGIDLWLQPLKKMTVQGMSSYNALSKGWMQHHYYVLIGPFGNLRLTGEASKVYYKEFFAATTMSAFQFPAIDPNETVTTLGGSADYAVTSSFTIGADFRNYDYAQANNSAKNYGLRLAYSATGIGAGLAVHRMDGPTDRLNYDDLRVYVTKKMGKADITLDMLRVHYKQAINGVNNSYTGTAAVGLAVSPQARLVADVEYAKNPDFNKDVRGLLTFIYRFDTAGAPKAGRSARATNRSDSAVAAGYRSNPAGQETL